MGTYRLVPDSVIQVVGEVANVATFTPFVTNANYLSGLLNSNVNSNCADNSNANYPRLMIANTRTIQDNIIRLLFGFSTNIISLDGAALQSFNNLPPGFRITSSAIKFRACLQGSDLTHHITVQFNSFIESPNFEFPLPSNVIASPNTFTHPEPQPSLISLFSDGCALRINNLTSGQTAAYNFFDFRIEGNYDIVNGTFSIDPGPYIPGDEVTIVSSESISEVILNSNGQQITVQVVDNKFTIPSTYSFRGIVSVIGTLFSGSVMLGIIVILIENASVIYKIMEDKSTDTIYDRDVNKLAATLTELNLLFLEENIYETYFLLSLVAAPGTIIINDDYGKLELDRGESEELFMVPSSPISTKEVKIPNPFIRTGYIG